MTRRPSTFPFAAVVFDMDGLLLDTEPVYRYASQRAAADLGFTLTDERYLSMVGRHRAACEEILVESFGAGFSLDDFNARWPGYWEGRIREGGATRKPGVGELLDALDAAGVPAAVATSSDHIRAGIVLEASGLLDRFAKVVTGDQVVHSKPAPDIYLLAASQLGVDPAACAAFEDSEPGARAAVAAGMTVFVVPDLVAPGAEVRGLVAAVLGSLGEATGALPCKAPVSDA